MYRTSEGDDRSVLVVAGRGTVVGIDRATGRQLWAYDPKKPVLVGEIAMTGTVDLEIVNDRVLVAFHGRIVCLDYRTGAVVGEVVLGSEADGRVRMVVDGGRIFAAHGESVHCLTLSGNQVWSAHRGRNWDYDGVALGFPGNVRQGDEG